MKANEFVKKYGVGEAADFLDWIEKNKSIDAPDEFDVTVFGDRVSYKPLKRIVKSHELVSNFGGVKRAKRILKKSYTSFNTMVSVVWNDKPFQCTIERLEQAIADVESCQ